MLIEAIFDRILSALAILAIKIATRKAVLPAGFAIATAYVAPAACLPLDSVRGRFYFFLLTQSMAHTIALWDEQVLIGNANDGATSDGIIGK